MRVPNPLDPNELQKQAANHVGSVLDVLDGLSFGNLLDAFSGPPPEWGTSVEERVDICLCLYAARLAVRATLKPKAGGGSK
jgi:hypothetical protein